METVGFVGVGKIGLPISENLIKSGYRVLGYRRSSLADFEKIGGVPAKSPADIGAQCNVVFSCVPTTDAMDEVVNGPQGLIHSARPGQIIVELGSHPVPDKQKHVATLAKKGAAKPTAGSAFRTSTTPPACTGQMKRRRSCTRRKPRSWKPSPCPWARASWAR